MHEIHLSTQQNMCVEFCLDPKRQLVAVTGAAGTGKTTLIKYIAAKLNGIRVAIAAPTGKAARRIREATALPAVTVHKLLGYGRPRDRDIETGEAEPTLPSHDKDDPIPFDVVLCDEYSMVNHELNRNLIDALPRGARLVMFGDVSQLSPIEQYPLKNPDSPFVQHLSAPDRAFTLEQVFRQTEGSDVLLAATAIRAGRIPRRGDNFRIAMTSEPVKKLRALLEELPFKFSELENQIITPVKNKWIGTRALNTMLRNIYNPNGLHATQLMRYTWDDKSKVIVAEGDKVVCTENTYDLRHYDDRFEEFDEDGRGYLHTFIPVPDTKWMLNGETGIVTHIHPDTAIEVDFGDRTVEIPYEYEEWSERHKRFFNQFPQRALDLAYALTTHKAQGSEYDNVMYIISKTVSFMLSRENMYTAVTRARKSACVVTDADAMMISLRVTREIAHKREAARVKKTRNLISDKARNTMSVNRRKPA
jgi:exodeoxyribonuclease V alpha subunit